MWKTCWEIRYYKKKIQNLTWKVLEAWPTCYLCIYLCLMNVLMRNTTPPTRKYPCWQNLNWSNTSNTVICHRSHVCGTCRGHLNPPLPQCQFLETELEALCPAISTWHGTKLFVSQSWYQTYWLYHSRKRCVHPRDCYKKNTFFCLTVNSTVNVFVR